jgi:hypothetical protein
VDSGSDFGTGDIGGYAIGMQAIAPYSSQQRKMFCPIEDKTRKRAKWLPLEPRQGSERCRLAGSTLENAFLTISTSIPPHFPPSFPHITTSPLQCATVSDGNTFIYNTAVPTFLEDLIGGTIDHLSPANMIRIFRKPAA